MSGSGLDPVAFDEHTISFEGAVVRYLEAGVGAPLVILHAAGGLRKAPAHDILARRFRVILIEQPGFGESAEYDSAASTEQYAATVHRAAMEIAGSPYNLVGTSFGSRIAAWIAAQFEGSIEALVLLSPTVFTPEGFAIPDRNSETVAPQLYAHPERQQPAEIDPAVRARQLAIVKRLLPPSQPDLEAALSTLGIPVLVVFGTEDRLMPPSLGHRYVELNPLFFLSFVYDAGHVIEEERPEALANLVDNFLEYRAQYHVARQSGLIFA